MNLANILSRAATEHPDRVALRMGSVEVTYAQFVEQSRRFAGFLREQGLKPGERVACWAPNCLEYLPVIFGAWWAGGVAVPLNYLFGADALRHAVTDSEAQWVLARGEDVTRLQELLTGLPLAGRIISAAGAEHSDYDFATISRTASPLAEVQPRLDDEDALLMYTSGSTGMPKGVRQTHRNTGSQVDAVIDIWGINGDDHALNSMPLFHVGGLQLCSLPVLARGGQITFMPKWDPNEWLRLVQESRPSIGGLISTMLIDVGNLTQDNPTRLDSMRICMFGGSRTPPAPVQRFVRGTGVVPTEIYGQTEQNGLAVTYRAGESPREESMGRALDQIMRWQLVPPGGDEALPSGSEDVGEFWVRGDAVTPGYWRMPELNAERFVDGWFRTGDLVRADSEGYLYYVDRIDDMIVSGGENVYPQMVESHLASCPQIAEVAIIGTADDRWVQKVTAVVVPSARGVSAEDIYSYCETDPNLKGLQRPKRIEFVDALPRTGSGKLNRPELRQQFP
ncbi:long-chain acyl-CoA synthetase [Antricoccus suffuscus]|uniref:Long-chain acyl-CoA synthetase n=1 Tax=Antricoccus suffuscus TaxID=1629062 RepID=A0A2T1A6I4_9ACTN|nr:class I adenylate-forming enzyme family protein [Antricoccus suffuscus]PRZ44222.1 long-chain acyl-CoA synthetase [Antricoccus suffuscus]